MAPKKAKSQKMGLSDFLMSDEFGQPGGSWADEVEDTLNATSDSQLRHIQTNRTTSEGLFGRPGFSDRGDYYRDRPYGRDARPMPNDPPFKAHISGLPFDVPEEEMGDQVRQAFAQLTITDMSPVTSKGDSRFMFVTFASRDDLVAVAGDSPEPVFVSGKKIYVQVADRRDSGRPRLQDARDLDWTRRAPPMPEPSKSQFGSRPGRDFGGPGRDFGPPGGRDFGTRRSFQNDFGEPGDRFLERRTPREEVSVRSLDWSTRKGPLSPRIGDEGQPARTDSHGPSGGISMESRSSSWRGRTPNAWPEGREGGSRPPRREFSDRPERMPTAAEKDMSWRTNMRREASLPGASPSADANNQGQPSTPQSPVVPSSAGSVGGSGGPGSGSALSSGRGFRPLLNLAKRSVPEPDGTSPAAPVSATTAPTRPSPFGAARPIDTATREREIAEKHQAALKARREAEHRSRMERPGKQGGMGAEVPGRSSPIVRSERSTEDDSGTPSEGKFARAAEGQPAGDRPAGAGSGRQQEVQKPAGDDDVEAGNNNGKTTAPAGEAAESTEETGPGTAKNTAEMNGTDDATNGEPSREARTDCPTGSDGTRVPLERQMSSRPREPPREREPSNPMLSRATDSSNWRQSSADPKAMRGVGGGLMNKGGRGGRGGARFAEGRPVRHNPNGGPTNWSPVAATAAGGRGGPGLPQESPAQVQAKSEPPTPNPEDEGWTTVPNKGRKGPRPVAPA